MKKIAALLLAFMMMIGLSACGGAAREDTAKEQAAAGTAAPLRTFTDDCGRRVEIPCSVTAVVPSGPLAQIALYAIAPEMMAGLAAAWTDAARDIVPDQYLTLPVFGQLYGSAALNVEELAASGSQLILDAGEAKQSVMEDLDRLQTLTGIPAVHVEASLAAMPEAFRTLGALLGKEEKGEELAQFYEKTYARTLSIMEQVGDDKVTALYVLGEEGQNVVAEGSYHSELLDLLVNNPALVGNPAAKGTGNQVTPEQIALWDPEFILFAPRSIYGSAAGSGAWKELAAIRDHRYVEVPEGPHNWMGFPPGAQRCLGMIWLTRVLYPDRCDYDVKAEVMEYYRLFYHCELTDLRYNEITANAFLEE